MAVPEHIHILGICGTFMAGVALIARALGYRVTGSDTQTYPPMSELLKENGIEIQQGYKLTHLTPPPGCVVIGNALSRGNPAVEHVLNANLPYASGPAWLAEHLLRDCHVLAVSGTHGKTTTASLLAWILEWAGLSPGFLIGGLPVNFSVSARLGELRQGGKNYFVIEADEYDTAFFDKRSKFIHYLARTLIINNVEYDHADIFPDLAAVQRQFHHLVRTLPSEGTIVRPTVDRHIDEVLSLGCWSKIVTCGDPSGEFRAEMHRADASHFALISQNEQVQVRWKLFGTHNVANALAAVAAAHDIGVSLRTAAEALSTFAGVRRRLEVRGYVAGVTVYDDFAHHPSAIAATIRALRQRIGDNERIVAIVEPRSNTMRLGIHKDSLGPALMDADQIYALEFSEPPDTLAWSLSQSLSVLGEKAQTMNTIDDLVNEVSQISRPGDHLLVMSQSSFGNLHIRLLDALRDRQ